MVALAIAIAVLVVLVIYLIVQNFNKSEEIEKLIQTEERLRKKISQLNQIEGKLRKEIASLTKTGERLKEENHELTEQTKELRDKVSSLEYQNYDLKERTHTLKNLAQNVQDVIEKSSKITDIMGMLSFNSVTAKNNQSFTSIKKEIETIKNYVQVLHDAKTSKSNYTIDTKDVHKKSPHYEHDSILELISLPLVENAFQHGDTKADDFLHIKYSLQDNIFTVEVKNKVNENEDDAEKRKYSGKGIEILKQRLEQFYPNQYKLESSKQNDEYWCYLQVIINKI